MSITNPKEEFLQAYKPSERFTKTILEQKPDVLPFLKKPKASYILSKDLSPHPNSDHPSLSDAQFSFKLAAYDPKNFPNNKDTPSNRFKNQTPIDGIILFSSFILE